VGEVVVGIVLVVLGAAGASAIARTLSSRLHGLRLALAVAPAGVLVGAGAALVRGWDLLGSAAVGAVVVAALAFATGLRVSPRGRRGEAP
jgi:hypothetical protein